MGLPIPAEMTGKPFFPPEPTASVPLITAEVVPGVSVELSATVRE
jgi:hypothetical protein